MARKVYTVGLRGYSMEIKALVVMLRDAADELERIEAALGTLQGSGGSRKKAKGTRKPMSAEARAKIAAAQKKRWAKAKKES
jgi:hypothetical protein